MAATLTSLNQVLSSLSALQAREKDVSTALAALVSNHDHISASLARLHNLNPLIDELQVDASLLQNKVLSTAKTADRVGGRVRILDEEMRRIREAAERVAHVAELKSSLSALYDAIDRGDWEAAARHCARVMAIPHDVLHGQFAASAVPTSELPLPPPQSLQAARDTLLYNFQTHFDKAARARDAAATSRFFKLFPSVGWQNEGLDAYSTFVVDLVSSRASTTSKTSSPMYFVASLTGLFESVALIIDQHQPIVEKYYGRGSMTPVVGKLLEECDRAVRQLLEAWEEERQMKRKLSETATFTATGPGTAIRRQGTQTGPTPADDTVDPREIDKVLSELAGIASRWAVFRKFVVTRLQEDAAGTPDEVEESDEPPPPPEPVDTSIVDNCACRKSIEGVLAQYYLPLESWYIRSIIDKAHRLAQPNASGGPTTTTLPDDVFYVLKLALVRLLTTGSLDTATRVTSTLREILQRDFVSVLKRKMDDLYRPGVAGARSEKGERDARTAFIVHLNDLDTSASHLERLAAEFGASPAIDQHFVESDVTGVRNALTALGGETTALRGVLKSGVEQLFSQITRPRLRMLWPDVYKDVSYVLDDESYALAEQQDLVRKRFVRAWEGTAEAFKDAFTEENYRLFFTFILDMIVRPWERYVFGLKFTELGAIRFDQDLRFITSFLSNQVSFGAVRERFQRLQQISTLVNLDKEEDLDEFYNGSGITWRLSIAEARSVIALRI
ncbi:COG4-domain-containing protein [Exidia glandulosa HHB12029]|uniref:Conserved oligomeric Golgi complex subunit 4 n=1 Tax=Exidia glandulosa HHB12029 TaxID=1314781 RepID=A0A165FEJ6_EXIGL|nr:COG4-domain-containing protein [Exidia glandulosa HHB12029]